MESVSPTATPTSPLPRFSYTIPEACAVTGLGRSRLYREIAEGRLRIVKAGKRTLISADAIRDWLRRCEQAA